MNQATRQKLVVKLIEILNAADDGQEDCEPVIIRCTAGEVRMMLAAVLYLSETAATEIRNGETSINKVRERFGLEPITQLEAKEALSK